MKRLSLTFLLSALLVVQCFAQQGRTNSDEVTSMVERFVSYAGYRSHSVAEPDSGVFLVTRGQRDVAVKVYEDLKAIPDVKVKMSPDYYVYALIPSNINKDVPSICFMSHLDITPEVPDAHDGEWVRPQLHVNYDGGDIVLGNGVVISPDKPEGEGLKNMIGHTIVTSDGTTNLGGDCKGGVAIMVELARHLSSNKQIKHGDIYLYFTQNEEVGFVADRFEAGYLGVVPDMIFDVDGDMMDAFAVENFSAVNGILVFKGNLAHPSEGFKSGYADASTAASYWIGQLPPYVHPSYSKGREGYIHIYNRKEGDGNVKLFFRLRYFNRQDSVLYADYFEKATAQTKAAYPRVDIEMENCSLLYDNVANTIHPKTEELLLKAGKKMGMDMHPEIQRAGTTCAILTSKGIAGGANIFAGQHAVHSVYEWVSIEELVWTMHYCEQIANEVTKLK